MSSAISSSAARECSRGCYACVLPAPCTGLLHTPVTQRPLHGLRAIIPPGRHLRWYGQAYIRRGLVGVGESIFLADHIADVLPNRRLSDEVQVRVWICFPALALDDGPRLTAARCVAGPRDRV